MYIRPRITFKKEKESFVYMLLVYSLLYETYNCPLKFTIQYITLNRFVSLPTLLLQLQHATDSSLEASLKSGSPALALESLSFQSRTLVESL